MYFCSKETTKLQAEFTEFGRIFNAREINLVPHDGEVTLWYAILVHSDFTMNVILDLTGDIFASPEFTSKVVDPANGVVEITPYEQESFLDMKGKKPFQYGDQYVPIIIFNKKDCEDNVGAYGNLIANLEQNGITHKAVTYWK